MKRVTYRDQANMREQRVVSDDLRRPWLVTLEKGTGQSTGPFMPCRAEPQWQGVPDEDVPAQKYLRFDSQHGTLVIYWGWWRDDLKRLIDPRTREPQPVTQEQLTSWRRLLTYIAPLAESAR